MSEQPAAARAAPQARRPLEARLPWPEIVLPVAVVVALLLDLMSDAHWGNLRLHPSLEVAAAAIAVLAAACAWLRCARGIARSGSARSGSDGRPWPAGFSPHTVCEGTAYVDSGLWRALEFAMMHDAVAAFAEVVSVPPVAALGVVEPSAIPCPAAGPPERTPLRIETPLQIEGALVLRRITGTEATAPGDGR